MIRFKIYFLNRSFTNAFKEITFYQVWKNEKLDLNHFRIVDNVEYKIISRAHLKISNDRVEKCILLRYDDINQYRILNLMKQKIKLIKDVRFQKQNHKSNLKIRSNINVNHESSIKNDEHQQVVNYDDEYRQVVNYDDE